MQWELFDLQGSSNLLGSQSKLTCLITGNNILLDMSNKLSMQPKDCKCEGDKVLVPKLLLRNKSQQERQTEFKFLNHQYNSILLCSPL